MYEFLVYGSVLFAILDVALFAYISYLKKHKK